MYIIKHILQIIRLIIMTVTIMNAICIYMHIICDTMYINHHKPNHEYTLYTYNIQYLNL